MKDKNLITKKEIEIVLNFCKNMNVQVSECKHWEMGGKGTTDLAKKVIKTCKDSKKNNFIAHILECPRNIQSILIMCSCFSRQDPLCHHYLASWLLNLTLLIFLPAIN